jgi:hypothetical protein
MIKIFMKFEVEDFAKWKKVFISNESIRIAAGSKKWNIFQDSDNPKLGGVISEWDSLEQAKRFLETSVLREAQQKSGVVGKPEIYVLGSM